MSCFSLSLSLSISLFYPCSAAIPLHLISLARIIIFMIAILVHGRLVEWTARLDFLWQLQASQEKKEMDVLQESNKRILHNLLPAHVAAHFLDNQFRSNMVRTWNLEWKKNLKEISTKCRKSYKILLPHNARSWVRKRGIFARRS